MFFWIAQSIARRHAARRVIDLEPFTTEVVTPERLIELYEGERDNIESVKILPGRLGDIDFGRFVVQRKRPLYAASLDEALADR